MDVTDNAQDIKQKLDLLVTKYGCIDILINNAGVSYRGEVLHINLIFIFLVNY